jgi:hypothetical protein
LPRSGKVVAVFAEKGRIVRRDQLQESQAEILARPPPLAES